MKRVDCGEYKKWDTAHRDVSWGPFGFLGRLIPPCVAIMLTYKPYWFVTDAISVEDASKGSWYKCNGLKVMKISMNPNKWLDLRYYLIYQSVAGGRML